MGPMWGIYMETGPCIGDENRGEAAVHVMWGLLVAVPGRKVRRK
jgi:hypothetical protein